MTDTQYQSSIDLVETTGFHRDFEYMITISAFNGCKDDWVNIFINGQYLRIRFDICIDSLADVRHGVNLRIGDFKQLALDEIASGRSQTLTPREQGWACGRGHSVSLGPASHSQNARVAQGGVWK
ncbi:hypothetical protein FHW96_000195 [Novosphingobium sp. SG751A]|uniref:hypothetical protein n=1 Tax=Novosphingobium sp. SG751A TaxID=2587000 RepID=UPI001551A719|nr:hypothetical protein [Novosphingobium sp. SG751A]NOW44068.1 hypothetical protein [Novosphingobium sp. SG751A]